ncbi:MAG: T9SS type A sorting domain-containing protein, partial [Flavobacteriales bacterium]|nr:T9SS type A sorting domain-containing protein [Flavobacteriales bacterium]
GLKDVQVYPNPTDGWLQMILPETKTYDILVYDMMGRLLQSEKIANEGDFSHALDLSAYPNGLYFVEIRQENKSLTKKIILSR